MSHRLKKDEDKRKRRGPTFVGLAPRFEPTKNERKEKSRKKHKKDLTNEE